MNMRRNVVPTVSVLIPAYNEVNTIRSVLLQVFEQVEDGFLLDRVIVYSDGSTDATVQEARTISDSRLVVIHEKERRGLATALNVLFTQTTADVAVILNADVAIKSASVLSELTLPIRQGRADLSAAHIEELSPRSFFEASLACSMKWKKQVFFAWKDSANIFSCFGPARAFSRRLYQPIRFPLSACDDAYSYLFCKKQGLLFAFVRTAVVHYRLPSTFSDHARQSLRYAAGMKRMEDIFGKHVVQIETSIPRWLLVKYAWTYVRTTPVLFFSYLSYMIIFRVVRPFLKQPNLTLWKMVSSSKTSVSL